VQSAEVKVDAALIEQLRATYAQLGARERRQAALDGVPLAPAEGPVAEDGAHEERYPAIEEGAGPCPGRNLT
jgi:hypothetical protein